MNHAEILEKLNQIRLRAQAIASLADAAMRIPANELQTVDPKDLQTNADIMQFTQEELQVIVER